MDELTPQPEPQSEDPKNIGSTRKANPACCAMGCFGLIALVFFTIFFGNLVVSFFVVRHTDTVYFTVDDKERVTQGSGEDQESKYLIFTEDGRVFENTDSLYYRKFDSANFYAKLKRGHRYKAKVSGYRIPWASMYQNIITFKEVPKGSKEEKT